MKPKKIILFIDPTLENSHKKVLLSNLKDQMDRNQYGLTENPDKAHIAVYRKTEPINFPTAILSFSIYNPYVLSHDVFQNDPYNIIDFIKYAYLLIHRHDALSNTR